MNFYNYEISVVNSSKTVVLNGLKGKHIIGIYWFLYTKEISAGKTASFRVYIDDLDLNMYVLYVVCKCETEVGYNICHTKYLPLNFMMSYDTMTMLLSSDSLGSVVVEARIVYE